MTKYRLYMLTIVILLGVAFIAAFLTFLWFS
jgi:hypothetical protein